MGYVVIGNIRLEECGVEKSSGLRLYRLTHPHTDDDFPNIVVPKGFVTNGASVPWYVRGIVSPTGEMFRAAVVHDYLYSSKVLSRRKADRIFRDIVYDDTGDWLLSRLAYLGIRLFGGSFWKKAKKQLP